MINNKAEFIKTFRSSLEDSGIDAEFTDSSIIIKAAILNGRIISDIMVAALTVYFITTITYKPLYLIPIIISFLVILYASLWIHFKSINIITIDLLKNTIGLRNRSIIRRIILPYMSDKKTEYYFKEIMAFEIMSNDDVKAFEVRYFVYIKLKDGIKIELISFPKKARAVILSKALTSLIT